MKTIRSTNETLDFKEDLETEEIYSIFLFKNHPIPITVYLEDNKLMFINYNYVKNNLDYIIYFENEQLFLTFINKYISVL